MGGKKRLTLKQMEKQSKKQAREKKSRGVASQTSARDKTAAGIIPPDLKNPKVIEEIKRLKVLTPYTVASRFNIRLSIARDFLEQLEEKGIIRFVSRSRTLKIYTPVD